MIKVRKGQAPPMLGRTAFRGRFVRSFLDPAFRAEDGALATAVRDERAGRLAIPDRGLPTPRPK